MLPYPHTTAWHWHPNKPRWPMTPAEEAANDGRGGVVPRWATEWLIAFIGPLIVPVLALLWLAGVVVGSTSRQPALQLGVCRYDGERAS